MNCGEFDALLPRLAVAGDTTSGALAEAAAHSANCARCARRLAVCRGEVDLQEGGEAENAVRGILHRTTGETCAAAEARLVDWSDGALSTDEAELVAGHLAHCAPCRALADALALLREELPRLAEVEPGPGFTASVLALTSQASEGHLRHAARTAAALALPGAPGGILRQRLRAAGAAWNRYWTTVLHRPRAALELAYGASLILCLIGGVPTARIREVSSEMAALGSRVPPPRLIAATTAPEKWWDGAAGPLRELADKSEERAPRGLLARISRAWKTASAKGLAIRDHGPILGRALLRLDLVGAWKEAELIRRAGATASEPAEPPVRLPNDRGAAPTGGVNEGPAASKGGTS